MNLKNLPLMVISFLLFVFYQSCNLDNEQCIAIPIKVDFPLQQIHSAFMSDKDLFVLIKESEDYSLLNLINLSGDLVKNIKLPSCKSIVVKNGKIYTSNYSHLYVLDKYTLKMIDSITLPKPMNNVLQLCDYRCDESNVLLHIVDGSNQYNLKITNGNYVISPTFSISSNNNLFHFHVYKNKLFINDKLFYLASDSIDLSYTNNASNVLDISADTKIYSAALLNSRLYLSLGSPDTINGHSIEFSIVEITQDTIKNIDCRNFSQVTKLSNTEMLISSGLFGHLSPNYCIYDVTNNSLSFIHSFYTEGIISKNTSSLNKNVDTINYMMTGTGKYNILKVGSKYGVYGSIKGEEIKIPFQLFSNYHIYNNILYIEDKMYKLN